MDKVPGQALWTRSLDKVLGQQGWAKSKNKKRNAKCETFFKKIKCEMRNAKLFAPKNAKNAKDAKCENAKFIKNSRNILYIV